MPYTSPEQAKEYQKRYRKGARTRNKAICERLNIKAVNAKLSLDEQRKRLECLAVAYSIMITEEHNRFLKSIKGIKTDDLSIDQRIELSKIWKDVRG